MGLASQTYDEAARKRIATAVGAAEAGTSAEIVPVVASASGRYDRAEDIVGVWCGTIAMALTWWAFQNSEDGSHWGGVNGWELPALLFATIGGFVIGAFAATHIHWLRRWFTPAREMREEVEEAARRAFFDNNVRGTSSGTGVLIYVSLYERRALVIADTTVREAIGQPVFAELCRQFAEKVASGHPVDAFVETIAAAGEKLAAALPRREKSTNELPDALVVID